MVEQVVVGDSPARLELRKYNPYLRKVTLHREIK